jgi:arylsulfatase A-like enzyme
MREADHVLGPRGHVGVALALLAVALSAGCSRDERAPAPSPPNVLLIAIDTLRADKLGCYGSELGATPRIDAFAKDAVRFETAYAHSPWTLPSFASLFTSLHPPEHGAGGYLRSFVGLADDRHTLAECFRDAGYATFAVINVDFLGGSFGMTQGFEEVDFEVYPDNVRVRTADRTTDAALRRLREAHERPFLMLVHYFDPHMVYAPPDPYRARFAAPGDRAPGGWTFGTRAQIVGAWQGRLRFGADTIRRAEKLYDGEVAHVDHEVGRLLEGLRQSGLLGDTVVVLTADHGEEFWDHGGFAHGHTLYEEQLRVPLLISWPGRLEPRSVPAPVAHVDLAPTLCELAGVAVDPQFVGRSLVPQLEGSAAPARPVLCAGNFWGPPILSWTRDGAKLVVHPDGGTELYDLRADPGETRDLAAGEPERVDAMREELTQALRARRRLAPPADGTPELTPAERDRLRALGYLE